MCCKIVALTQNGYLMDKVNILDGFIALLGLLEISINLYLINFIYFINSFEFSRFS